MQKHQDLQTKFAQRRGIFARLDLPILELDEVGMKKRVALNQQNIFDVPPHPRRNDIVNWTLNDHHRAPDPPDPLKDKDFWFIECPKTLLLMVEHLSDQNVIAVDLEFDNIYSFYDITCLIQISSKEYNFVIDAIKLFNEIPSALSDVFLNEDILKVVFGTQDVTALQRDFSLRLFPVIDFQNAYKMAYSIGHDPGLKDVVKNYLGKDVDKTFQRFVWRSRPIPPDALILTEVNHIRIVKEIPQTKNTQNEPVAPADIVEVAVMEFDCDNDSVFDKNITLENDVVIENDIVELVELDTVETKAGQNVDCIKNESSNPFHVVAFDKNDDFGRIVVKLSAEFPQ
ncbi:unnamed protein product [Orchesella dallaii]|uniref:3'-5' exonuclease domain-containing protein n=1 Tax=Orchesella dallaii TaxID=48710 RepID=A0ABP1RHX7_9HEXA